MNLFLTVLVDWITIIHQLQPEYFTKDNTDRFNASILSPQE